MDLKNAARKLWHSDVEEDQVYSVNSATYASMLIL